MRLFVAVNFSPALRERLYAAAAPLRQASQHLRWLVPDTYHITLKFLGTLERAQTQPLEAALNEAAAAVQPFDLELGGLGAFPSLQRARIVWLGARATGLMTLRADVEQRFEPLGFPTEARPFHPHITMAKLAARARPVDLTDMERLLAPEAYQVVRVERVELMESKLSPAGALYALLHSAQLGNRDR